MPKPSKPQAQARPVTFNRTAAFEESFPRFAKRDSVVMKNFAVFLEAKGQRPPGPLPRGMRDHALTGLLSGFKECHLAGDACLLYTDKGGVVTLILVCDHDDMYGPKAKSMAKRIEPFREEALAE